MKPITIFILLILILPVSIFSITTPEKLYKKAMSEKEEDKFIPILQNLISNYPNDFYGQKSFLELAKIEFLKRNYQKSLYYLNRINNPALKDAVYWFSKVYLKLNKNIEAIYSAQNYIYLNPNDISKDEDMLITIAQAFIQKKSYYQALNTLNSLRKSKYAQNKIPLIVFKTAECYEKMGKIDKAIKIYKKMKIDFPYDQYTYIAQDKIYELASLPQADNNETKKLNKANVSPKDFDLYLQAGAYRTKKSADLQKKKLTDLGLKTEIVKKIKNGKPLYVVYLGPFEDTGQMKKASVLLKNNKIDFFIFKKYHE